MRPSLSEAVTRGVEQAEIAAERALGQSLRFVSASLPTHGAFCFELPVYFSAHDTPATCSKNTQSVSERIVVVQTQMGDLLFSHQITQSVFQLH